MKLKQKVLIVGGSMLFAVPGCDDGGDNPMVPGDLGTIPRDSMLQEDLGSTPDGTLADMNVSVDMSVAVDSGGPMDDMGTESDSGSTEPDAATMADMSVALPDMSILDAAMPQDMAIVIPDAGIEEDQGPPPGECADLLGQRCENDSIGCCENDRPVVVCRGGSYVEFRNDIQCNCPDGDGVGELACAVPGFVGIHRANEARRQARRLRDLIC